MLTWALSFALLALIPGILGYSGLAQSFAAVAKVLLVVFLILLVITLVAGGVLFHAAR